MPFLIPFLSRPSEWVGAGLSRGTWQYEALKIQAIKTSSQGQKQRRTQTCDGMKTSHLLPVLHSYTFQSRVNSSYGETINRASFFSL